jgi:DNA-binding MarR family transcriptional regulator
MIDVACACSKLRRSARIVSNLYDEALAPSGMTVAQFALLRWLKRLGPCSMTAFAEATAYDRTTLNRTLGALQKAGFVGSTASEDQRVRIVAVTEQGETAIRAALPGWSEAEARIDAVLGPARADLFALLDRVETLRP